MQVYWYVGALFKRKKERKKSVLRQDLQHLVVVVMVVPEIMDPTGPLLAGEILPFLTELWVMWILVSCSAFGHYGSPSVTLSPGLLHLLTISGPSFWFCADPPQSH